MHPICITIIAIFVLGFAWSYRHAFLRALDYIFLPKKKREFVNNNEKFLGRKYSKEFWDKYMEAEEQTKSV